METPPGVSYAEQVRVKREADDVRVLTTIAARPAREWGFREVLEGLPDLTADRVRAALTRLTQKGELRQGRGGQENHYHWRLASTPLQEEACG